MTETKLDIKAPAPVQVDDDSDSDEEIIITLTNIDTSKMTPEELAAHERDQKICEFCRSMGRTDKQYRGHLKEDCRALAKMRCNYCAELGHTGGHCKKRQETNREIDELSKQRDALNPSPENIEDILKKMDLDQEISLLKQKCEPLTIKCAFCFRANKSEKFYMSHSIDKCRFKTEYNVKRGRIEVQEREPVVINYFWPSCDYIVARYDFVKFNQKQKNQKTKQKP
jgi:hypothetical protein